MSIDRELTAFIGSLTEAAPPAGAGSALRGVWHALRGEWDSAHHAVQPETPECAWVHAVLHRQEGDLANAEYWYRLAGRARATCAVRDEYLAVAAVLLRDAVSAVRRTMDAPRRSG